MDSWRADLPDRLTVLGAPLDPLTMQQCVAAADSLLQAGEFAHIIGVNADKVLQMRDDAHLAALVRGCEIAHADGISALLAAKLLGFHVPERVAGIDLMSELCALAVTRAYSVFLLGAKPETVRRAANQLRSRHPGLNIVGVRDGYFSAAEEQEVLAQVRAAAPDLVFVGITSPKKEELIEHFRAAGSKSVFLGVGGSFDVVAGDIPRAPVLWQRLGVEWLFRLLQEPWRLARRYLVGNTRFLWLLVREKLRAGSRV